MQKIKDMTITLDYDHYTLKNGVYWMTAAPSSFEEFYIDIREKEGRVLSDEAVRALPVSPLPAYRQEWAYRRYSADIFLQYLKKQSRGTVLDLGCGNGWFSNLLTLGNSNTVLGLDINMAELQQAARLFANDHCRFAYGDIFEADIPAATFQYIVIDSAVQYFPDLPRLLHKLLTLLKPNGEIHIFDSPFYRVAEIPAAALRTKAYYEKSGTPEMAAFYHHHSREELNAFQWKLMYDPQHWWQTIKRKTGLPTAIFPWIKVMHPL